LSVDKVWIQKFKQWKSIVQKGCPAGAGPGGILCTWIGRNCNYNDCPRRNLEEIYVRPIDDKLELTVEELQNKVAELEEKLKLQAQKQLEIVPGDQEPSPESMKEQLKKIVES